MTNLQI